MTAEDKNNIDRKTDPSKCEAIYFGESKRSVRSCDCEKNEIAIHCWITTLAGTRRMI